MIDLYIYIDVLAGLNFILNALMLFLTGYLNGLSWNPIRLFGASLAAVLYLVAGLALDWDFLYHPFTKFLFSYVLIYLYFGKRSLKTTCILWGSFYFISFLFGGAVFGFLFMLQSHPTANFFQNASVNFLTLTGGTICACGLLFLVFKPAFQRLMKKDYLYNMKICCDGKTIQLTALLDTGNHLYTMGGRYPVVVVNQEVMLPLLPAALQSCMKLPFSLEQAEKWHMYLDNSWNKRIYIIPYKGIGEGDFLLGIHPDQITVKSEGITTRNAVVGIYQGTLSPFGEYEALLHLALLKNP